MQKFLKDQLEFDAENFTNAMLLSLTEEEEESFGDEKSQSSEKDHMMD